MVEFLREKRLTIEVELVEISTTVASASCAGLILAVNRFYKLITLKPGLHAVGRPFFLITDSAVFNPYSAKKHIYLLPWKLKTQKKYFKLIKMLSCFSQKYFIAYAYWISDQ